MKNRGMSVIEQLHETNKSHRMGIRHDDLKLLAKPLQEDRARRREETRKELVRLRAEVNRLQGVVNSHGRDYIR